MWADWDCFYSRSASNETGCVLSDLAVWAKRIIRKYVNIFETVLGYESGYQPVLIHDKFKTKISLHSPLNDTAEVTWSIFFLKNFLHQFDEVRWAEPEIYLEL